MGKAPIALPSRRGRSRATAGPAVAAAAFGVPTDSSAAGALRELPVNAIRPNPGQPRKRFDPDALMTLAASIAQRGLLQPVVVRPLRGEAHDYELVAGERRWRATQLAGLATIPSVVSERDDVTALTDALIENMVRADLTPVEEARSLRLLHEDLGVNQRELGEQLGRSRPDIANTIRLLDLPEQVLERIDAGELTKGHGKVLLALATQPSHACRLAAQTARERWSVRQLEQAVQQHAGSRSAPAPRVPDEHRQAATRLTEALTQRHSGARVAARRDGFVVQVPVKSVDDVEALVRQLTGRRTAFATERTGFSNKR